MEEKLALRIRLFRETGQVRPAVADFVAGELEALAAHGRPVSEENAGMLTSHLMMALTRAGSGEPVEQHASDDHVAAELAGHQGAVRQAEEIAARAQAALGAALPDSEVGFLALHLAVLAQAESGERAAAQRDEGRRP